MTPIVSVLIPTYNQVAVLKRTIESIQAQTFEALEILIGDDCSTDETTNVVQACQKYDRRILYHRNDTNLGRVKNYYNLLHNLSKGKYVVNVDGDDFLLDKHFIAEAINEIQNREVKDGKILFYIAKCTKFFQNTQKYSYSYFSPLKIKKTFVVSGKEYFTNFKKYGFAHLSTVYNRELAISADFYTKDILSTDIFSILSLCLQKPEGSVVISTKIVAAWSQHESNASKVLSWEKLSPSLSIYFELYRTSRAIGFSTTPLWVLKQTYKPVARFIVYKILSLFF